MIIVFLELGIPEKSLTASDGRSLNIVRFEILNELDRRGEAVMCFSM